MKRQERTEQVTEVLTLRQEVEQWPDAIRDEKEDYVKYTLSETLKVQIHRDSPLDQPSVYSELLDSALANVNWCEIADDLVRPGEVGRKLDRNCQKQLID